VEFRNSSPRDELFSLNVNKKAFVANTISEKTWRISPGSYQIHELLSKEPTAPR